MFDGVWRILCSRVYRMYYVSKNHKIEASSHDAPYIYTYINTISSRIQVARPEVSQFAVLGLFSLVFVSCVSVFLGFVGVYASFLV